jgi:hypothetical protein
VISKEGKGATGRDAGRFGHGRLGKGGGGIYEENPAVVTGGWFVRHGETFFWWYEAGYTAIFLGKLTCEERERREDEDEEGD